jgi:hypothetical protein
VKIPYSRSCSRPSRLAAASSDAIQELTSQTLQRDRVRIAGRGRRPLRCCRTPSRRARASRLVCKRTRSYSDRLRRASASLRVRGATSLRPGKHGLRVWRACSRSRPHVAGKVRKKEDGASDPKGCKGAARQVEQPIHYPVCTHFPKYVKFSVGICKVLGSSSSSSSSNTCSHPDDHKESGGSASVYGSGLC